MQKPPGAAEVGASPWANRLIPVELTGAAANAHLAERNRLAETDHPGLIAYLFVPGTPPGRVAKREDEVLYPRGTRLRIVAVNDGASLSGRAVLMIEAELIP